MYLDTGKTDIIKQGQIIKVNRYKVILVNPNLIQPPIAPIGLDYLADDLFQRGYDPYICDLTFASDWKSNLKSALSQKEIIAIGISVRNIDDAYFASQDFILAKTKEIVDYIKTISDKPIVLGGVGFSCAPYEVLEFLDADFGIIGDGETKFANLLDTKTKINSSLDNLNNVIYKTESRKNDEESLYRKNRSLVIQESSAQYEFQRFKPKRTFIENRRYFEEGGQSGIETKRGCNQNCIYCVDPLSKGKIIRLREPQCVVDEINNLLNQGINVFHLCDSEFNIPINHSFAVCEALIKSGISNNIYWYTYASLINFDIDLAKSMAKAGCIGINFGIDHLDEDILRTLGRSHSVEDAQKTAKACRDAGIAFMFDMLFGAPGETKDSIERTISIVKQIKPDRVGLSCGVRVYPHTKLAKFIKSQGSIKDNSNLHGILDNNDNLLKPIFYVDSSVGSDIHKFLWSIIGDDKMFFLAKPNDKDDLSSESIEPDRNYNYNDNSLLVNVIKSGKRGAYWDILRQIG